jgi:hypothetical protein
MYYNIYINSHGLKKKKKKKGSSSNNKNKQIISKF